MSSTNHEGLLRVLIVILLLFHLSSPNVFFSIHAVVLQFLAHYN